MLKGESFSWNASRIVSIYLPTWPTDRLRRKLGEHAPTPETPLVLAGREKRRRVIQAADRAAHLIGLRPGMPITKAQALAPGLVVMEAQPDEEHTGLVRLALWLQQRIAPIVALDAPDGLILDTTGADHLHGGEESMLKDIVRRLAGFGVTAKAAIAETHGAAHALARYTPGRIAIAAPNTLNAVLSDLPVAALRLPSDVLDGLHTLGLHHIRDLDAAPRAPLTRRFGAIIIQRLDQAFGRQDEPLEPIRPENPIDVQRGFAEPIAAAETIARYAAKLVAALCTLLAARGLGARQLLWRLHRVDGRAQSVIVAMARPIRDERHLTRLLIDRIETIDPGFGIERMVLTATRAEPIAVRQHASSLGAEAEIDITALLDTLSNRIGHSALYRYATIESDIPERSVTKVSPLAPDDPKDWPSDWPRPARLLPHPEQIETMAMLPDRPPAFFTWRGIRRRVRCADGPERVFGEWWKNDAEMPISRDYFRVEDEDGQRFWLYREGDGEHGETGSGRWFLHGFFG